jgi:hypothetical protein
MPTAQQRSIVRFSNIGAIDTNFATNYTSGLINSIAYEPSSGNILLGTSTTTGTRLNYLTNLGAAITVLGTNGPVTSVALVSDGTTNYFAVAGSFTKANNLNCFGLARLTLAGTAITNNTNQSVYEDIYSATIGIGLINKIIPKVSGGGFYTVNTSPIAISGIYSFPFMFEYNVNSTSPFIQLNK